LEFYEISVLIRLKFSQLIRVNIRIAKFIAVLGVIYIILKIVLLIVALILKAVPPSKRGL